MIDLNDDLILNRFHQEKNGRYDREVSDAYIAPLLVCTEIILIDRRNEHGREDQKYDDA